MVSFILYIIILQKYKRLCYSTHLLVDLFDDLILRTAILSQIGPLMAALLQLSHAPLAKPLSEIEESNINKEGFYITIEEYQKLQKRQKEFHAKFISLLNNCPRYICFRELMVILGMQNAPKWLRKVTQDYLIKILVQSNGVLSLITAICEDDLDLGVDWKKLETVSKLIAASHGKNAKEYYKAVCPQVYIYFLVKLYKTYICINKYIYHVLILIYSQIVYFFFFRF